MKVILVNGSPHSKGTTDAALNIIKNELELAGIEGEVFWVGTNVSGCLGCNKCKEIKKCIIDDKVNEFNEKMKMADGLIVGSPVYYAAPTGQITSFLNRAFVSGNKENFRLKPAASISVARRAGTTSTFDQLNKYFAICEMPIISSNYWNMVFGATKEDIKDDEEGISVLKTLARNMSYILKLEELGQEKGIEKPISIKAKTNFVRK